MREVPVVLAGLLLGAAERCDGLAVWKVQDEILACSVMSYGAGLMLCG